MDFYRLMKLCQKNSFLGVECTFRTHFLFLIIQLHYILVSGVYLSNYTLHNWISGHPKKSCTYLMPYLVIRLSFWKNVSIFTYLMFLLLFCIFLWLFYYSCPNFPPLLSLLPPTIFPVLYFPSLWLFCNNQFVFLNLFILFCPSANAPCLLSGNHQKVLCICDSVSVLLVCLFCCLDSIVDRCVFIATLLFFYLGHVSLSPHFGSLTVFVSLY